MSVDTLVDAMETLEQAAHRADSEEKAVKALQGAKTRFVLSRKEASSVFFATLVLKMKFEPDWNQPTCCVDGKTIWYNPDFVLSIPEKQLIGVLAHEVLHCTNRHHTRRGGRDPEDWNKAADCAINDCLREAKFELPVGALYPGVAPYQDLPPNLSAEEYYVLIHKHKPPEDQDQDQDGEPGDGQGKPNPDPGGCGGVRDAQGPHGQTLDESQAQHEEASWRVAVAQAEQAAAKRGTLSAGLARMISEFLEPKVDWRQALREFISQKVHANYNWKRPNRRHLPQDLYLPSIGCLEIGHIVAVIDTSGSIGQATLDRFASELQDITNLGVARVTILYHDAAVVRVDEWNRDDGPLTLTPCGGGGTDHHPVFQWIDESGERPDVVVCLTDLCSSFPASQPDYPVLWASTISNQEHPWGDRIDIPPD